MRCTISLVTIILLAAQPLAADAKGGMLSNNYPDVRGALIDLEASAGYQGLGYSFMSSGTAHGPSVQLAFTPRWGKASLSSGVRITANYTELLRYGDADKTGYLLSGAVSYFRHYRWWWWSLGLGLAGGDSRSPEESDPSVTVVQVGMNVVPEAVFSFGYRQPLTKGLSLQAAVDVSAFIFHARGTFNLGLVYTI